MQIVASKNYWGKRDGRVIRAFSFYVLLQVQDMTFFASDNAPEEVSIDKRVRQRLFNFNYLASNFGESDCTYLAILEGVIAIRGACNLRFLPDQCERFIVSTPNFPSKWNIDRG